MSQYSVPGNFPGLLRRLAIAAGIGQPQPSFNLADIVLPVALVDPGDTPLQANALPPIIGAPFSAGELAAPLAGVRLADSGALAAGNYWFFAMLGNKTGNLVVRLGRRNAADAAWVWSQYLSNQVNTPMMYGPIRAAVLANERIALDVAVNSAGTVQGSLFIALT